MWLHVSVNVWEGQGWTLSVFINHSLPCCDSKLNVKLNFKILFKINSEIKFILSKLHTYIMRSDYSHPPSSSICLPSLLRPLYKSLSHIYVRFVHLIFWGKSLTEPGACQFAKWACQQLPGILMPSLLSCGDCCAWFFMWMLEIQIYVLMTVQ